MKITPGEIPLNLGFDVNIAGHAAGAPASYLSTIRLGDWKLIYYYENQLIELFNIKNDIGESVNLAETNSQKVAELAQRLTDYLIEADAQIPLDKTTMTPIPYPANALKQEQL